MSNNSASATGRLVTPEGDTRLQGKADALTTNDYATSGGAIRRWFEDPLLKTIPPLGFKYLLQLRVRGSGDGM